MKLDQTQPTRSRIALLCLAAFTLPFTAAACGTKGSNAQDDRDKKDKTEETTTTVSESSTTASTVPTTTGPTTTVGTIDPAIEGFASDSVIDRGDRESFKVELSGLIMAELEATTPIEPGQEDAVQDYINCVGDTWYDNPSIPNYMIRILSTGKNPETMSSAEISKHFSGEELAAFDKEDLGKMTMIEEAFAADVETCITEAMGPGAMNDINIGEDMDTGGITGSG